MSVRAGDRTKSSMVLLLRTRCFRPPRTAGAKEAPRNMLRATIAIPKLCSMIRPRTGSIPTRWSPAHAEAELRAPSRVA